MGENVVALIDHDRDEQVYQARVRGQSVRQIAWAYRLSTSEVEKIIDRLAPRLDVVARAQAAAIEVERLNALHAVFYNDALEGKPQAAMVCLKIGEHIRGLLGLNAPLRVDPIEVQLTVGPSSTDKIEALLEAIVAERQPATTLELPVELVEPVPEPPSPAA
jgi:hypothetical protein